MRRSTAWPSPLLFDSYERCSDDLDAYDDIAVGEVLSDAPDMHLLWADRQGAPALLEHCLPARVRGARAYTWGAA